MTTESAEYTKAAKRVHWLWRLDWYHVLRIILLTVIIYQYEIWFRLYWAKPTARMVLLTFGVVVIAELFYPLKKWMLRAAEILLLLIGYAWIAGYHEGLVLRAGHWRELPQAVYLWITGYVHSVNPYLWFGLAAWLLLIAGFSWLKGRLRVMMLLIFTVLLFAGVDSFSTIYFWDQVAATIICGLALLIVEHFKQFRNRYPENWQFFMQYPGVLAFTIVTLMILVSLGMLAPNVHNVLTDPYTLIMQWRGQTVSLPGKGEDFAGAASGHYTSGYARSDSNLGAGFDFDYTPVMTVSTDHASYWRGETRSFYTGKGWQATNADLSGGGPVNLGEKLPGENPGNSKLQTESITESFHILHADQYPVLFGAYKISQLKSVKGLITAKTNAHGALQSVENDKADSNSLLRHISWTGGGLKGNGELKWQASSKLGYPLDYTIVSEMPVIDGKALRTSTLAPSDLDALKPDLQLPAELPGRVKTLAKSLTKDETNEYDKVKAIENYLRTHYKYNNKPDLSKAKSRDFVDSFLFDIKEGYCDYYSTAMAVMVRTLGIPARWVVGYTSGSLPEEQYQSGMVDESGSGVYTVRNSDAHSWVEVYFSGYGWIPFEPTAGFSMPEMEPKPVLDLSGVSGQTTPAATAKAAKRQDWRIGALVFVVVLLFLIGWLIFRRMPWIKFPGLHRKERAVDWNQAVIFEFNRLVRKLRRKGYRRESYETVKETLNRWGEQNRYMRNELSDAAILFEQALYAGRGLTEAEYRQWRKAVEKMKELA